MSTTKEFFGVFLNSDLQSRAERKALYAKIRHDYTCEGFLTRQGAEMQATRINEAFPTVKAHAAEYLDIL